MQAAARRGPHRRYRDDGAGPRGGLRAGRPGRGGARRTGRQPRGHRGRPRSAAGPGGAVPAGVRVASCDQERAAATARRGRRTVLREVTIVNCSPCRGETGHVVKTYYPAIAVTRWWGEWPDPY